MQQVNNRMDVDEDDTIDVQSNKFFDKFFDPYFDSTILPTRFTQFTLSEVLTSRLNERKPFSPNTKKTFYRASLEKLLLFLA